MKEKEQKGLKPFVPAKIPISLPSELEDLLKKDISKAQESIMIKEKKEEKNQAVNDINDILLMIDSLDEETSKGIYKKLQEIIAGEDKEEKDAKLKSLKDELVYLQTEQTQLMPKLPSEIVSALPTDVAKDLEDSINEAYMQIAKQETPEVPRICNDKHSEVKDMITEFLQDSEDEEFEEKNRQDEISPIPSLSEELMKILPQDIEVCHDNDFDLSLQQTANTDIQNTVTKTITKNETKIIKIETEVNGRDNDKEEEQDNENDTNIDLVDEDNYEAEDMSLPPTPAINPPWAEIASRPERPSGPTPAKSEDYERKHSGPFTSLGVRKELFLDEREVSPELIDSAKKTISNVIEDAKEKLTNIAHGDIVDTLAESNKFKIKENSVPTEDLSNKEINTFGFSSPLKISTSHYGNKI